MLVAESSLAAVPLAVLASKRGNSFMSAVYRVVQHAPREARRLSGTQAHLGMERLASLQDRLARRTRLANLLKENLPESVRPQRVLSGAIPNYYFFVAQLPMSPAALRMRLLWRGYDAGIREEIADDCATDAGKTDCPNVAKVFSRAVHLPLHEGMTERDVVRLASLVGAMCK